MGSYAREEQMLPRSALGRHGSGIASMDPTSHRILDTAMLLFGRHGTSRVSLEEIARTARIGRMTMYRRFATRADLIDALYEREMQRFLKELLGAVSEIRAPSDRIAEAWAFFVTFVRAHPLWASLNESGPDQLGPFTTPAAASLIETARAMLAQQVLLVPGQADVPVADAELAAETAIRVAHSWMITPEGGVDVDDPEEVRDYARRFIAPILTSFGALGAR